MKLVRPPDRDSYRYVEAAQVLSAAVPGGLPRQRQDLVGASPRFQVGWTTDARGYEYLRAFHQLTGAKGLPFAIDLVLDSSRLAEYQAAFVPKTFGLVSIEGDRYKSKAELEVQAVTRSYLELRSVVDSFTAPSIRVYLSDLIALVETITDDGTVNAAEARSELVTLVETIASALSLPATPGTESLTPGEAGASALDLRSQGAETLQAAEALVDTLSQARLDALAETLSLGEAMADLLALRMALAEAIAVGETAADSMKSGASTFPLTLPFTLG